MKIEFIFAEEITDCESISELNCEDSEIPEGKLVSSKELCEYCAIAEKILTEAENYFPTFAKDTGTTVSVYFMGNENIREINAEQREIDRATDVLSFPFLELREGDGEISEYDLNPENGAIMLGDILVSVEKMKEQAKEYGHSMKREMAFLALHGLLHVLGYDHIEKDDEKVMFGLQKEILNDLEIK
jgi:probable rRNA maturation factor